MQKPKLGEQLVAQGLISDSQLQEAVAKQAQGEGHIGSILIELGHISIEDLLQCLRKIHGVPGVNLFDCNVDEEVLKLVAFEEVQAKKILPIAADQETITLAMVDPTDHATISEIQFILGKKVKPMVVPSFMLEAAMKNFTISGLTHLRGLDLMGLVEMQDREKSPRLKALLQYVIKMGASDLLLTAGAPPSIKIANNLQRLAVPRLTPVDCRHYARELLSDEAWDEFRAKDDYGFSATYSDIGRFRMNVYRQRGSIALAIRPISDYIPTFEELNLPAWLTQFCLRTHGLILISGPSGHGKTTTMAAMVDVINKNRACNIVTLEDPIEFLHRHQKSNVNQREIGRDTGTFAEGIRHVFRQAPDVVVVGELRDPETFEICLRAANTGHLVLTTVHSDNATNIIDRAVNMFDTHQQNLIRMLLAETLLLSIAQRLVPKKDGTGRILALEKFISSSRTRNFVREGKVHQIRGQMQGGSEEFHSLDVSLAKLVQQGLVAQQDALIHVDDERFFTDLLRNMGL
jgi:twitching motility protein PilT